MKFTRLATNRQESGSNEIFGRVLEGLLRATVAVVCMAVLALSGVLHAQTGQGNLTGEVVDSQGARVAGASVQLTNADTGVVAKTLTDKAGFYTVSSINPGKYTMQVRKTGFEGNQTDSIIISAGQTTTTNIKLKVGSESVSVTVTAQGNDLSTTSDVATTVEHRLVEDLPYPERSALEAVLLVPGVTGDPLQPGGIASENPNYATGAVSPGGSLRVGGSPPGKTSILVDGSDVTQASYPRAGINLSGDLVQESTVITSGLSAKYGRTGGGVIIQASKPGTSQYHGGVTYRHTDPFFNAFPDGTQARSSLHQNFFAAYFAGPVRIPKIYNGSEKTFFFLGFEPARLRSGISLLSTLPMPAELQGHLKDGLVSINTTILKNSGYAAAVAAPRVNHTYYQYPTIPAGKISGVPQAPFPSGVKYASSASYVPITNPTTGEPDDVSAQVAQNPFAAFILSHMPSPANPGPYVNFLSPDGSYNSSASNAVIARGVSNIDNRYSIRIDHQIGNSDRIFGRFTSIPVYSNRFFGVAATNPIDGQPADNALSSNAVVSYTHVFSNELVNEAHFTYLRDADQRVGPPSALNADYGGMLGLTPATAGVGFPTVGSLTPSGFTTNTISVGLANSSTTATTAVDENYDFGDDLTWTHGKHLFQFGGELRRIESNEYNNSYAFGGDYTFNQTATNNGSAGGSPIATLSLGLITAYFNSPVVVPAYYRWHYYAGYFQDDWKILPTLTLNLGARYEVETPRMEKFNNQAYIDLTVPGTLNSANVVGGFCFSTICNSRTTLFPTNYWGIEPRIGLAWAPTQKTTVRAAYTITRVPLTGYEASADPNLGVAGTSVGGQNGGVTPNSVVDSITNPVGPLSSAFTNLTSRGPFFQSPGITVPYVRQTSTVPYIQSWAFTVQYQPMARTLLQVGYQGQLGLHLIPGSFTISQLNTQPLAQVITGIQNHFNFGATVPNPVIPGVTESALTAMLPYQNYYNQSLNEAYPRNGVSTFNGLNLSARQSYGYGLSLLAYYSWQKTIDDFDDVNNGTSGGSGNPSSSQSPNNLKAERSVAVFDQPSILKAGFTYKLPIGVGKLINTRNRILDGLLGGVNVSGIMTAASGFPNYVTLGNSGYFVSVLNPTTLGGTTATTTAALPAGYTLRPNLVPGVPLINPKWRNDPFAVAGGLGYLNPAAFAVPGSLNNPQFGNEPRTMSNARSPREFLFDMALRKQFYFENPRYHVEINGTFSNVLNHPVFFGVNTHTAFASSGTLVGAGATGYLQNAAFGPLNANQTASLSRVIQIGGKFTF